MLAISVPMVKRLAFGPSKALCVVGLQGFGC
jgi:hypothetical protein